MMGEREMPWAKIHAYIPGEEMWHECFPKEFSLDEDMVLGRRKFPRAA